MGLSDDLRENLKESALSFHLPRGFRLGEHWEVEELLGGGGMGNVHRVRHIHLGKRAAAKVLQRLSDEDLVRFIEEARCMARVEHENVARLLDYGEFDGEPFGAPGLRIPYYVMEYLDGEDLEKRLRRVKSIDLAVARPLLLQIMRGLAAVHRQGLVHRDIKPGNIVIVPGEAAEVAKIVDFGLAKSTRHSQRLELTQTGMVIGSMSYLSPEQISGEDISERTDIYALGVVIYRVITGTLPFAGDVPALLNAHLSRLPDAPSKRSPEARVPRELDRLILRCMAKRPEDRFATMSELADALAAVDAGRASAAKSRSIPALALSAATMLAALVVLIYMALPENQPPPTVPETPQHPPEPASVAPAPTGADPHLVDEAPQISPTPPETPEPDPGTTSAASDPPPVEAKRPKKAAGQRPTKPKEQVTSPTTIRDEPPPPAACSPKSVLTSLAPAITDCRKTHDSGVSRPLQVQVLVRGSRAASVLILSPDSASSNMRRCVSDAIKAGSFADCADSTVSHTYSSQ